jgi:hypothetical protein
VRPGLAFITKILARFQSNPGLDNLKVTKKVLRYMQGAKGYMLIYTRFDNLEVIRYSDCDYASCVDIKESTSGYVFTLARGGIS